MPTVKDHYENIVADKSLGPNAQVIANEFLRRNPDSSAKMSYTDATDCYDSIVSNGRQRTFRPAPCDTRRRDISEALSVLLTRISRI